MKPADALIGSDTPIFVHPGCQPMLGYEGELTVMTSRRDGMESWTTFATVKVFVVEFK
jgi:hypothetical protein